MLYADGLETARLTTRFLESQDAAVWESYFGDPINCTFVNVFYSAEAKEERASQMVNLTIKRYQENRLGLQALIEKQTGELIGMCGLLAQDVNGTNETEIGYHLLRKHWGKGYASEAAQKFRDYGFEHHFSDSLVSIIHPLNFLSKNVALRNGMTLTEPSASFRGHEVDIFRITRAEWEKL
jgi:RimJ/RimL family protein N-acetyltransferase